MSAAIVQESTTLTREDTQEQVTKSTQLEGQGQASMTSPQGQGHRSPCRWFRR